MPSPITTRRLVFSSGRPPAPGIDALAQWQHRQVMRALARVTAPAGPLSVLSNCGLLMFDGRQSAYEYLMAPHVRALDLWAGGVMFLAPAPALERGDPLVRWWPYELAQSARGAVWRARRWIRHFTNR